ncbi:GntR family transcriptional regulator [Anaerobacillus sp. CMMVII]|uniref:GntR family transcriptional regulator n=1 Tax=Anaerobacillus sp. CMMVII TaxID=2755588 RepID=UPI0021B79FE4|nr:GntR family transcriptional regulator [Anaerobacillus sp. CMMVII]MCT8139946.1 GntR family transcriptional regulator [Anaerobacillus sp. CMMVII]
MTEKKSISSENPVFLYEQVIIKIKEMIANGEIAPDEKLPNESELCDLFDTSRITIRRALKELANEGVIEILHGRGTFVRETKQQIHILNLKGYTEGMWIGQNSITKKILSNEIVTADEKLMELFERKEPFEVLKLARLIKDSNKAFSVDFAYFPLDIYPGISDLIEDNVSTFNIIHNKYGIKFGKARKEMEIVQPSPEISNLLDVSRIEPLVQIKKLIRDEYDVPVHYSKYYLYANKIKFYIDVDMNEEELPH